MDLANILQPRWSNNFADQNMYMALRINTPYTTYSTRSEISEEHDWACTKVSLSTSYRHSVEPDLNAVISVAEDSTWNRHVEARALSATAWQLNKIARTSEPAKVLHAAEVPGQ